MEYDPRALSFMKEVLTCEDVMRGMFRESVRACILAKELYGHKDVSAHVSMLCDVAMASAGAAVDVTLECRATRRFLSRRDETLDSLYAGHTAWIVELQLFSAARGWQHAASNSARIMGDWLTESRVTDDVCHHFARRNEPLVPRMYAFLSELPLRCTTPAVVEPWMFPLRSFSKYHNSMRLYGAHALEAAVSAWIAEERPVVAAFLAWLYAECERYSSAANARAAAENRRRAQALLKTSEPQDFVKYAPESFWLWGAVTEELKSRGVL